MSKKWQRLVLTGATGGIGKATAKALDNHGYCLLLTGRNEEKLKMLCGSLKGVGHRYIVSDLTSDEGIKTLSSTAFDFEINGVVNCMGINELATIEQTTNANIARIISTNLVAPINVCKVLIPQLKGESESLILNVGSILGSIGYAGSSIYCSSKFGLRGFTESLRRELGDTSISVMYLAPRATNTSLNTDAMNQMNLELGNTLDEPDYVAEQIVKQLANGKSGNHFLGWPESFFVKLNGLFPTLVDKALSKQLATIRRYCGVDGY